jgi:hypothetical protein
MKQPEITTPQEFFLDRSKLKKHPNFSKIKNDYIDKEILENLTVGDMHGSFSKMVDWDIWKQVNAKTHACKSFINNKKAA